MKKFSLLSLFLLLFISCNEQQEELSIAQKIADANGFQEFKDVKELKYTFNVRVNDSLRTSRGWTWRPQDKMATMTTADTSITYNYESEAEKHPDVDPKFINDQYWLLFPFHLAWDEMDYEHIPEATAPLSGEKMQQVTVTYPAGAGYTPGDSYEIYFKDDYMIQEWIYLKSGSRDNPLIVTWEDYQNFNGIHIAQRHRNKDKSFELFFTGIEVVK